jgi:hypothetical protein
MQTTALFLVLLCLISYSYTACNDGCCQTEEDRQVRRLWAEDQCFQKFAELEELFDQAINSRNPNSTAFQQAMDTLYSDVLTPNFYGSISPGGSAPTIYFDSRATVTSATAFLATRIFTYRRAITEYIIWNSYSETGGCKGLRQLDGFIRITQFFTNATGFYYSDNHGNDRCVEVSPGEFRWAYGFVSNDAIFRAECASAVCAAPGTTAVPPATTAVPPATSAATSAATSHPSSTTVPPATSAATSHPSSTAATSHPSSTTVPPATSYGRDHDGGGDGDHDGDDGDGDRDHGW